MLLVYVHYRTDNNGWDFRNELVRYNTPLKDIFTDQLVYNKRGQLIPLDYRIHEEIHVFLNPVKIE